MERALNWPVGSSREKAPSVSMGPGATPSTRMPWRPHSTARLRVSACTPAFAMAEGATQPLPSGA